MLEEKILGYSDFLFESMDVNDIIKKIGDMTHRGDIKLNLDVKVDPALGGGKMSEEDKQKTADIIRRHYVLNYLKVLEKYGEYYKEGTGDKTNGYHEPCMNFAYNYIEHPDFLKTAKEPRGGYRNNQPVGELVEYKYYQTVWSIACEWTENDFLNNGQKKFRLKLDHRYKRKKNYDFDGTLVVFSPTNNKYWKDRNLPSNQRYY